MRSHENIVQTPKISGAVKAAALINDEKATAVIEHITYDVLDDHYSTDVFTDPTIMKVIAGHVFNQCGSHVFQRGLDGLQHLIIV